MLKSEGLKNSLAGNISLWIALWILLIVNIFALITISKGFYLGFLVITVIIVGLGILLLQWYTSRFITNTDISNAIFPQVRNLMDQVRPFCDEIFLNEINRITEPILGTIEDDFSKGMGWLWENNEEYLLNVEQGIAEINAMISMTDTVSGSKIKTIKKLQEKLDLLLQITEDTERVKVSDQAELEKHLHNKAQELKQGMSNEKEIFYDYVEKLLIQQIKNNEHCVELGDYLNMEKLGEQFSLVIEKSIQARLSFFKDTIIKDLEYMSADIVGQMQKGALQLINIFNDIDGLVVNLMDEYRNEDAMTIRRLKDSQSKILELKEQTNDFLVTLAWQDILIEKRWQDVQVKLFMVKDQVVANVNQEVTDFIITILQEAIPNFASLTNRAETSLIYKACLDAETIYQLSESENMQSIIGNSVYSLLQFIRPVELMVGVALRFSEIGISERRLIKDQLRQAEYLKIWEMLIQAVKQQKPELISYLDDLYPKGFASFCNSPYIRQKPENVNDAAWMLFMAEAGGQDIGEEGLLLIGLLLFVHRLRNKYVHPLKSLPLPLENIEEIDYIRFCAYKSIDILASLKLKGIVKNKLNS